MLACSLDICGLNMPALKYANALKIPVGTLTRACMLVPKSCPLHLLTVNHRNPGFLGVHTFWDQFTAKMLTCRRWGRGFFAAECIAEASAYARGRADPLGTYYFLPENPYGGCVLELRVNTGKVYTATSDPLCLFQDREATRVRSVQNGASKILVESKSRASLSRTKHGRPAGSE